MFYLEKVSFLHKVVNLYFHPVNYNGILNALSTIQCYISYPFCLYLEDIG